MKIKQLVNFFFPLVCVVCKKEGQQMLCKKCEDTLKKAETEFILNTTVLPCFKYEATSQTIITNLKYKKQLQNAKVIAQLILKEHKNEFKNFDFIIPVSTSFVKRFLRGYNCPNLIANELKKITNIKVLNNFLKKRFFGVRLSQVGLTRKERLTNLQNAFFTKKQNLIQGKKVLLIDDVITTGSTIKTCLVELLKHNPKELKVISFLKRQL